mmetsp:Transcript_17852/g.17576  ORF Transcript_17852/g.17576 Transcript_17852/m.17576 type:complete len:496 (-) Transcript_17852:36-1523(-)
MIWALMEIQGLLLTQQRQRSTMTMIPPHQANILAKMMIILGKIRESMVLNKSQSDDEDEDTGYDGWNDVKKAESGSRKIPDPYSKQKKYDPYPEDDFVGGKSGTKPRGKTTVGGAAKKKDDYFSGSGKKKDFDTKNQPKAFDFDGFGQTVEKKSKPGDDFEDAFNDPPSKKKSKPQDDDPFNWGNDQPAKKTSSSNNDFDFDFNAPSQPKKTSDDFFGDEKQEISKTEKFDPFNMEETSAPVSSDPVDALADVKFDSDPFSQAPPAPDAGLFDIPAQNQPPQTQPAHDQPPLFKKEKVEEKFTEDKLFNLSNLTKNKPSVEKKDKPKEASGFGQSNFNSNFDTGAFGNATPVNTFAPPPTSVPETKEDKLNALESAFGSVEKDTAAARAQASMAQAAMAQNMTQQQVNDFGQPKAPLNTANSAPTNDFGEFPTMFGSNADGFGSFQGFGGDAFGNEQPAAKPAPVSQANNSDPFGAPQPQKADTKTDKKDDWFEF